MSFLFVQSPSYNTEGKVIGYKKRLKQGSEGGLQIPQNQESEYQFVAWDFSFLAFLFSFKVRVDFFLSWAFFLSLLLAI